MNEYLEKPILTFIKNNQHNRIDSVDIASHFRLRADITLGVLDRLVQAGKVERLQPQVQAWYEYRWGLED